MKNIPPNNNAPVVTAADVARLAGVSQSAVSRAFTVGASVAPATRKRIQAVAEQLGYQPNLIARSLTSGRSNIVGVGVERLENSFFAAILDTLSARLAAAGLRLLLFTADHSVGGETSLHQLLQYRLDALVLLSISFSSKLADQCQRARVPVVLLNRVAAIDGGASSVIGDNKNGAKAIATFLLAGEHRRMAYIQGTDDSSTSRLRENGFSEHLLQSAGMIPLLERGHFTREAAAAATRRLLSRHDRPDAIFCANDHMAIVAIEVAQSEFGIDVGRELSIVGFDNGPMASWPSFSLTTYAQPIATMVDETVMIIEGFQKGLLVPVQRVVEGSLVLRSSARRPSRKKPSVRDLMIRLALMSESKF